MDMMLTRRAVLGAAVASPFAARAQSGLIKIIIPFSAGGPTDVIARHIQTGLQNRLGVSVIVENRTGGTGMLGAGIVSKSPPDGSTWLLTSDSLVLSPLLLKDAPVDPRHDLEPVTIIGRGPEVLSTHPDGPFKTVADLVAAAKASPDTITFGSSGTGGNSHLSTLLFSQRAGIRLVHVPYRGVGQALNDAVAGHLKLVMASTVGSLPLILGGKLRGLVQMGAARASALPDVPTMAEVGYPGTQAYVWYGLFAPRGTPAPIVERFVADLRSVLAEPEVARQFAEVLRLEMSLKGPADLRAMMDEMFRDWGPVIRDNKVTVEN